MEPVEAIRNIRGESNVDPKRRIPRAIAAFHDKQMAKASQRAPRYVEHLARVAELAAVHAGHEPEETKKAATGVTRSQTTYIPYSGLIDIEAERARLTKEIARAESEIKAVDRKLGNESFTAKAPAENVERERAQKEEAEERLDKLRKALAALG